ADFSLVVVIVLFVVLIFILNATIFKPILKVLDERERLTSGAMSEAKHAVHDYDKRLSNYEEQIRAARAESYRLLESKRAAALNERGELLQRTKTQLTEKIEANKREIESAAGEARGQLETDAHVMAESISRNLLKRPLGGTTS